MREIKLEEDTFRRLVRLKNFWSLEYRKVTNPRVIEFIEKIKLEIFGYNSHTPEDEVDRIVKSKSKEQLQKEAEAFSRAIEKLLVSGYDFEPEYTFDQHIKKMLEVIEEGEEIARPIY